MIMYPFFKKLPTALAFILSAANLTLFFTYAHCQPTLTWQKKKYQVSENSKSALDILYKHEHSQLDIANLSDTCKQIENPTQTTTKILYTYTWPWICILRRFILSCTHKPVSISTQQLIQQQLSSIDYPTDISIFNKPSIDTIAIDESALYINEKKFNLLSFHQKRWALFHEIGHKELNHHKKKLYWNSHILLSQNMLCDEFIRKYPDHPLSKCSRLYELAADVYAFWKDPLCLSACMSYSEQKINLNIQVNPTHPTFEQRLALCRAIKSNTLSGFMLKNI